MTHLQQIVQQLADVSGSISIHNGVATLENGEQINLADAVKAGESDEYYRHQARQQYGHEGTIEVDSDALVSHSVTGAYVEAWVWVDSTVSKCECGRDLDDCATAEGANFCMDRDEYLLYDCPCSYEHYLTSSKAGKGSAHDNQ